MKIGIFGGTFNPPHIGHLIVVEHVRQSMGLTKVIFVPAAVAPHKREMEIIEPHHRAEMLRRATNGNDAFEVSDIEIRRGGISFSVNTLQEFKKIYPNDLMHLIIGMDNLTEFHTWREPEKIIGLAGIIAMTRPGVSLNMAQIPLGEKITLCEVPEIAISSSEIRKRVREGKPIRYLVPVSVAEYIREHRLYL